MRQTQSPFMHKQQHTLRLTKLSLDMLNFYVYNLINTESGFCLCGRSTFICGLKSALIVHTGVPTWKALSHTGGG